MHQPSKSLLVFAAYVALLGLVGLLVLPVVSLAFAVVRIPDGLGDFLWEVYSCMFPFMLLRPLNPSDGDLTAFPIAFTFLQWGLLAVGNVVLARIGISVRPLLSALALVSTSTLLALMTAHALNLRFAAFHI